MNTQEMQAAFDNPADLLTREFPAKWEAPQPGEILIGEYLGSEKWAQGAISGTSYLLKLLHASDSVVLTVGGAKHSKDVPASPGQIVALSGAKLAVLSPVPAGSRVAVRFDGLSEYSDEDKKRISDGKQALKARTKLFTVARISHNA